MARQLVDNTGYDEIFSVQPGARRIIPAWTHLLDGMLKEDFKDERVSVSRLVCALIVLY